MTPGQRVEGVWNLSELKQSHTKKTEQLSFYGAGTFFPC